MNLPLNRKYPLISPTVRKSSFIPKFNLPEESEDTNKKRESGFHKWILSYSWKVQDNPEQRYISLIDAFKNYRRKIAKKSHHFTKK